MSGQYQERKEYFKQYREKNPSLNPPIQCVTIWSGCNALAHLAGGVRSKKDLRTVHIHAASDWRIHCGV